MDSPTSITLTQQTGELILERRWFNRIALTVLLIAIGWNLIFILFISQPPDPATPADPDEIFLLVPFGIVGLLGAYLALAGVINRTRITLSDDALTVTHAPLPWVNRRVPRAQIAEVRVKLSMNNTSAQRRRRSRVYSLVVDTLDGGQKPLIGGLSSDKEAAYIRQTLHRHLDIRDNGA